MAEHGGAWQSYSGAMRSHATGGDKLQGAMSNGRDMPSDDRSEEQMFPAERLAAP